MNSRTHRTVRWASALLSAATSMLGCRSSHNSPSSIHVEHCIARLLPNGMGAAYLRVVNTGAGNDTLRSAESPWVRQIEVHDVLREGDVVRMRELPNGIAIEPHSTTVLSPGGMHLMLRNVVRSDGAARLPIIMHFSKAGTIPIDAEIVAAQSQ